MILAGTLDGHSVAAKIPTAAQGYDSAAGRIGFDDNGDRATGDTDYYGLFNQDSLFDYRYYAFFHDGSPDGRFEVLSEPEVRQTEFCPEC